MFLWRNKQNYPLIITKYPHLFHCVSDFNPGPQVRAPAKSPIFYRDWSWQKSTFSWQTILTFYFIYSFYPSRHDWKIVDWDVKPQHNQLLFLDEPRHDKTNKVTMCPAKTQISLGIRPVWSESSPCAQWVAKDPRFLHADSEASDQTRRMPRLIWVFAGRTCHFVGFVMRRLNCFSFKDLSSLFDDSNVNTSSVLAGCVEDAQDVKKQQQQQLENPSIQIIMVDK